jgi:hypothetical protein
MNASRIKAKRKPGRPATGTDPMVGLRMPPSERAAIEGWAAKQVPKLTLSKAIRQLATTGLAGVLLADAKAAKRKK